ncbi:MAG: hypothetical protein ACXWQO_04000 [Bdellovibrionota bacterium]
MKNIFMFLVLAVSTAYSANAFCKSIEDGSSFTGSFQVQEQECEKSVFSYVTGKTILVPDFSFAGTTLGLKQDGMLIPVEPLHMNDHGGGIITGAYGQYDSSSEFTAGFIQINLNNNQGQKTTTVENFKIDNFGTLLKTTTTTIGDTAPVITGLCHFVKSN